MINTEIIIKYFSSKMLALLDLNFLVECIMDVYGDAITIKFETMNTSEKNQSSRDQGNGIIYIDDRIWIIEERTDGGHKRNHNLEKLIKNHST